MIPRFGRSIRELEVISIWVLNHIFEHHKWELITYCQTTHDSGAPLQNWFVDGTLINIFRPRQSQMFLFDGHKRVPAVKFQSADGLTGNLFDPIKGTKPNVAMLKDSSLLGELTQFNHSVNVDKL